MLIVKSLHIVFMVSWFAGLFYLPRLFVYHAMADDQQSKDRFKIMERKLYFGIMTPSAVLTVVFGTWLWLGYGITGGWLMAKLAKLHTPALRTRRLSEIRTRGDVAGVLTRETCVTIFVCCGAC